MGNTEETSKGCSVIYIAEAKQKFRIKLKWYFTPTIKKKKGQHSSLAKLAEANARQL